MSPAPPPQVSAQPAGRGDGALGGAEAGDGLPAEEADGAGGAARGQGAGARQVGRGPQLWRGRAQAGGSDRRFETTEVQWQC